MSFARSDCYNKVPQAYKQQKFISHRSGSRKSELRAPAWSGCGESCLGGCRLLTSHCSLTWQRAEGRRKLSHDSHKGTNFIHEGSFPMISPISNYLPKTPPPNTIILGHRVSTCKLGWGYKYSVQNNACKEKKVLQKVKL